MFQKLMGACVGLAMMGMAGPANAVLIEMSFTVDFVAPAPQTTVSGTITWNAASATASIDSLLSIDMIIAGHAYTLSEIGFVAGSPFPGEDIVGGVVNGVGAGSLFTNDFFIHWVRSTATPSRFFYSVLAGGKGDTAVGGGAFSFFSITEAEAVPEPSTLAIFVIGLAGLGFMTRRRRGNLTQAV